jgi:hypothetical protein
MDCERTRELAPELALGIADGAERAAALRHLAGCPECRRAVQELSELADELLLLTPAHEPPLGFESRVLARLPRRVRRRPRLLTVLAPAAAAAALAAGIVLGVTRDDVRLADQYRDTLDVAHGSSFAAARLRPSAGVVYAYRGEPSWIFVYVDAEHRARSYRVELTMTSGRRMSLPSLRLDRVTGSAGSAIPYDVHDVAAVRLIGTGGDVLEARLPPGQ